MLLDAAKVIQKLAPDGMRGRSWRNKSFHSLRHTLPSWLRAAGVDQETRMRIVGHSSKGVHQGYTHHEIEQLAGALRKGLAKLAG